MSGGARVNVNNAVCLYLLNSSSSSRFVTIGGDFTGLSGPVAKIDLYGNASDWSGKTVLRLADDYLTGNLPVLKSRFTLGNFVSGSGSPTPITGYAIADNGTLIQVSSIGITNVSYNYVSGGTWTLQSDGRRKSPAMVHNSVAKSRVGFTAPRANASIMIKLDVSSEAGYDYAFISTLDNANATYESGYYTGSRISGTTSVTITIPVSTAGSHFVDIGYRKDGSVSNGSDCAWYRVLE
jgi:hypothetical protein